MRSHVSGRGVMTSVDVAVAPSVVDVAVAIPDVQIAVVEPAQCDGPQDGGLLREVDAVRSYRALALHAPVMQRPAAATWATRDAQALPGSRRSSGLSASAASHPLSRVRRPVTIRVNDWSELWRASHCS